VDAAKPDDVWPGEFRKALIEAVSEWTFPHEVGPGRYTFNVRLVPTIEYEPAHMPLR
jgi:hypothetical protein